MCLDRHSASKFQLVFNVHVPGGKRLALKLVHDMLPEGVTLL